MQRNRTEKDLKHICDLNAERKKEEKNMCAIKDPPDCGRARKEENHHHSSSQCASAKRKAVWAVLRGEGGLLRTGLLFSLTSG